MSRVKKDFNPAFTKMKKQMKEHGFYIPRLCANMRNSKQIAQLGTNYSSNVLTMNNAIETLPCASVFGHLPRVIHIDHRERESALGPVIHQSIQSLTQCLKASCIILHTRHFSSNDIRNKIMDELLKNTDTDHDTGVISFPLSSTELDSMELHEFLSNPNNILVTNAKYFVGCEAPNVILCIGDDEYDSDFYNYTDSIRCNVMRAVANLIIISCIKTGGFHYTFDRALVEYPI